jgi:hypothetical protein
VRYFIWLGVALLATLFINAFRKRKLNPGSVALLTLGIFYLLDMVGAVVGMANSPVSLSSSEQGSFFGRITGSAIIPLGIAVLIRNHIRKQAVSEEQTSPGTSPPAADSSHE